MEPQSAGSPTSPSSPGTPPSESTKLPAPSEKMPPSDEPFEEAALKPNRQSSSSSSSSSSSEAESLFHLDAVEISSPLVAAPDNDRAAPGDGAEVKPDNWALWPEQLAETFDNPFLPDGSTVFTEMTQAPEVQTMPKAAEAAAAPADGFDPQRIPASVFQTKTSSSQAEWSVASNESLFSIHGASQSGELYDSSRSHFDYFYDEAMAASGGGEPDWKLPTVAEGSEAADAFDTSGGHGAKLSAMPGSARSDASAGSAKAKKADAFRRHESGSGGSSSNFSFAFPILAETSPKKKESAGGGALYQPLQKECEPRPQPLPAPMSAFEEMTTEEERRRTVWCWCGECCGCCWFACSWSSCCCCCSQRRWWCCDCGCSCPSLCRCNWCICF